MRLNRRVPVGTHGGVRGRLSDYEDLLLDEPKGFPLGGSSACRKRCVSPLAPSARGLRPQAVGERTVRQSEIFRAMARFSPSAPTGHLPRRGRFFDTLGFRLGGRLCLHQFLQYRILHDHPGGRQAEHLSVPHGVPVPDALPHKDTLCRRKPSAAAFIRRDVQPADQS